MLINMYKQIDHTRVFRSQFMINLYFMASCRDLTGKGIRVSLTQSNYSIKPVQESASMKNWILFVITVIMKDDLVAELTTLRQLYHSSVGDKLPSVNSIKTALSSLSTPQQMLLKTVSNYKLFQLLYNPSCNKCYLRKIIQCSLSYKVPFTMYYVSSKVKPPHDFALPSGPL